jgi:hypothetical protein
MRVDRLGKSRDSDAASYPHQPTAQPATWFHPEILSNHCGFLDYGVLSVTEDDVLKGGPWGTGMHFFF